MTAFAQQIDRGGGIVDKGGGIVDKGGGGGDKGGIVERGGAMPSEDALPGTGIW